MTNPLDHLGSRWIFRTVCSLVALSAAAASLTACGGSSDGRPVRGGTLNMIGAGDVDYMDPNVSYYTTGYLALRMWSRQLLTYPAVPGHATSLVPDLAVELPSSSNRGIGANGRTYTLTIRRGAMWDTSPPRQVTGMDVIRGLERTCNPAQPFGGLSDFESLILGMQDFCNGFAKVPPTVDAIKAFLATDTVKGVRVQPSKPLTVTFTLTRRAPYFPYLLAMPAFSPAPAESLNFIPGSSDLAQHTISDGPYEIASYVPGKSILFVRNPAWRPGTDSVRKAFVNRVRVTETLTQSEIVQRLGINSPGSDMGWDTPLPAASVGAFLAARSSRLTLGPTYGLDPFLLFNTASPNNSGALQKRVVRQALEYAIDRPELVRDNGGAKVAPPLTHVLPPGVGGSKDFDPYPFNPHRANDLLYRSSAARISLKVLYQPNLEFESKMLRTLQADLAKVGVSVTGVPEDPVDFYTKVLEVPSVATSGGWDLAFSQWLPDWYGNAAYSFFFPLFSGRSAFPPTGSNFGLYDDPKTDQLIARASTASSPSAAAQVWAETDRQVMTDAAVFPIASPATPLYHAMQVHNAVFVPYLVQYDPTNVWLTPSKNGG